MCGRIITVHAQRWLLIKGSYPNSNSLDQGWHRHWIWQPRFAAKL